MIRQLLPGNVPSVHLGAGAIVPHDLARIDTPKSWSEVRGPLEISGWALSPHGIRRVIVHFDMGRNEVIEVIDRWPFVPDDLPPRA